MEFEVMRVPLPVQVGPGGWGYGTAIIGLPGTTSVLFTLPGGARTPWCTVDLPTGRILRGTGMPGPLRAALFPSVVADDPRPWVLGAYGLGRLQFEPRPTVTDVVRKSLGKWQTSLVDLGSDLLGVGHRRTRSMALVNALDGRFVKRFRAAGGGIGYGLPNGQVRILGLHHAEACDFDPAAFKVTARHAVPYGTDAVLADDAVIALVGERRDIERVYDVRELPDEGTSVLSTAPPAADDVAVDLGWNVLPRRVVVCGAIDLRVRREESAPAGTVQILGRDSDGRIVLGTRTGLVLLDQQTLSTVAEYRTVREIGGAGLCAATNAAALIGADEDLSVLTVVRW
ncbi:hypothetical protein [Micromonospora sp. CA-244673]|uniref:hypothetical protein n=1 Tax=Micromonospora sp. CA-244673 TaxID=3239958 RepID=UPI003D92B54F